MNSNISMHLSSHGEIIGVLTELHSLLDTLAAIEPCLAPQFHPPDTGIHPPTVFNADAACAAGFDAESVEVLSALPYLNVRDHEMHTALQPNTYPISYLQTEMISHAGERCWRKTWCHLQLTWEEGGCGLVYICDTKTSKKGKFASEPTHIKNNNTELITP